LYLTLLCVYNTCFVYIIILCVQHICLHHVCLVCVCVCAASCFVCMFAQTSSSVVSTLVVSTNSLKMVKDQSVFDAIKRYGVAGKPLEQNEVREVCRLAEVGKHVIEEAAFDLVRSAQHKPLLFSYCGDGTPLKLKSSFQIAFAEHHKLARSGYTGRELYCQGGFLRTLDAAGEPIVRALLKDPRPMAGKSALCAFNGLVEFFPTLDQCGHDGFHIHHYSWDRALFSACKTLARKYHTVVLRKIVDRSPQHTGTLKVLRSWLLCTGCGLHDIHNGFTWGISKLLQGHDNLLDDLYIVLESLRSGFGHLQSHISGFLLDHVVFKDCGWRQDDLHQFWTALDVDPELAHMLAERKVWWSEERLHVSCAFQDDPEIFS
jgi:hypothetical protein